MRVKAVIAYDGSSYQGFQRQKHTTQTVMGALEKSLKALHIESEVVGSGRTDAGVHATGQVIHFDLPEYWENLEKLMLNLNRKLTDIQVKQITKVPDSFHARFSAQKRLYRYIFKTTTPSVFEKRYVSYYKTFDPVLLKQALKQLEGTHDFQAFQKTGSEVHSTERTLYKTAYLQKNGYHFIYFLANGFLRSQVRMMVESVMECARREKDLNTLREQLEHQSPVQKKLAPHEGLYLARVTY